MQFDLRSQMEIADIVRGVGRRRDLKRNAAGLVLSVDAQIILENAARFNLHIRCQSEPKPEDSDSSQVAVQTGERKIFILEKVESQLETDGARFDDLDILSNQWTLLSRRRRDIDDCDGG